MKFKTIFQVYSYIINISIIISLMQEKQSSLILNNHQNFIINQHYLKCQQGLTASFVCSNPLCQLNAFKCDNKQCACYIKHNNCNQIITANQFVTKLSNKRRQPSEKIKTIFDSIFKNYDELIDKLSEDRIQFMEYTTMFGLTQDMINIVKSIQDQHTKHINSKMIYNIMTKSQNQNSMKFPMTLSNFQANKLEIQLQMLMNELQYQLTQTTEKINKGLNLFNETQLDVISVKSSVVLDRQYFDFIPIQIVAFTHLKGLDLSKSGIRKITNLNSLSQLQNLELKHNRLTKIENLQKLVNLTYLNLQLNQITKIQNLCSLENLQYLMLSQNKISIIENLESLQNLSYLDLMSNKIIKIQNLDSLHNLIYLNLNSNSISKVQNIQELQNLQRLLLDGNPLQKTQEAIQILQKMKNEKTYYLILPNGWEI